MFTSIRIRLNTSYDMVLFEGKFDKRMKTPLASKASENDDKISIDANVSSLGKHRGLIVSTEKICKNLDDFYAISIFTDHDRFGLNVSDAPIEITDSDDEIVEAEKQTEPKTSLESSNGNVNLELEHSGADFTDANDDVGVCIKRELKVETEFEMDDLSFVEFDPTKDVYRSRAECNVKAAEFLDGQSQPSTSSSSNSQKQLKRTDGKQFKCSACAYTARYKYLLKRHQQIHGNIKPYKCHQCGYASRQRHHLQRHQRIHDQQKLMGIVQDHSNGLFKCNLCDQQFVEWDRLTSHLTKSHKNNQRLFNCGQCRRRFAQKSKKDKHEIRCRTRRYECYVCKKFVAKCTADLKRHMRIHTGEKPFQCMVCNRYFRQRYTLKYHLNSIHKCK